MHTTSVRDFKKEKILGKGSFGSVYLVRRRQDNKIYALKTVILEKLNKKEQENSVNEVRILASVNHPNVIGYKEAFWDDEKSSLNIVMEYADDGDLHSKIEKMKKEGGCFKEPIIWSYAIQMIEGLKALHDMKIMHRDLKSANIFLVKDKHQCKLGDMNVSKVIKEKFLSTQTGTPYYASPEVWNDNPYSYKSDLWSIGCVIYELCALRPPFQGKDLDELYENVCKGEPERINQMYSNDLWKMILMLLQVDVNKRVDCNQFLNNELIKKKIEEMKNDPNSFIEAFIYDKNKDKLDEHLLKTIKFNNIKEIKAQLPTKKNYNSNFLTDNLKYTKSNKIITNNNMYSKNNEEILSKKIKAKQMELEKMKNYLNKNEKSKTKIRKKKIINIKENTDNGLKHHKTIIYKKNNLSNSLATNEKRQSFLKEHHNELDFSQLNSGKKSNVFDISERGKKIDVYELYLKKNANKLQNYQTNSYLDNDRCKTPMAAYNKILNNKLIPSIIQQTEKSKAYKKIPSNCLTYVDRKKEIKYIEEEDEKDENKPSNTLEANHNYIYNKPNLIIKKKNSIKKNNVIQHRPQSATPIYKRAPKLNPSLYKSNLPVSISFRKEKAIIKENKQNIINTPHNNKKENIQENNHLYPHKLNRYYSYGVSITTPTNSKMKSNIKENEGLLPKNPSTLISPKPNSSNCKKYMKKLNVKSYQQKLKAFQKDNFFEKKAMYGKIFERERNEEKNKDKQKEKDIDKDKDKDKEKIKGKKKLNINIGNSTNKKNGSLISNNSNAFLNHIKSINAHEGVNPVLNCYLSPKNNNSQVFNNFYSINLPVPVKVINVFKK